LGIIEDSPRWKKILVGWGLKSGSGLQEMKETQKKSVLYPYYFVSYYVAYLLFFKKVRETIGKKIKERNQDLARIEQVKKFTILDKEFQQDDEEVTPTLKVKRRIFEEKYKDQIVSMYTE
jgi:long-subunit acyl-CoA synthetase (AMP-forming)